jgi:hypothetical protein
VAAVKEMEDTAIHMLVILWRKGAAIQCEGGYTKSKPQSCKFKSKIKHVGLREQ